jgi:hypothetical protein
MRLYEIYLLDKDGNRFDIGCHPGTWGEALLKARYAAKKRDVCQCRVGLKGSTAAEQEGWEPGENIVVEDVGPAQWDGDYTEGKL